MKKANVRHSLKNYFWLIMWVFLSINAILVIYYYGWQLMTPHMVEWIELRVLNAVYWWRRGFGLPYPTLGHVPFFWNPYGFVYEGICYLLPSPFHPYFSGRAVSLLATLSILMFVVLWVRYWTGKWSCSLLAAMLLLTSKPFLMFGVLYRVDMVSVMLSIAGFALVFLTRHWLTIGVGILLMIFSFHTKLTAVAAPIASVISLWKKDRLKALLIGSIWLTLTISSLIVLQIITNGNYLQHAILGNEPSQWLKPFDMMIIRPLKSSLFWVTWALYSWCSISVQKSNIFKLESSYLIVAWLVAGIIATNPGSSWNYLLEFYIALALLTGKLVHSMLEKGNIQALAIALLVAHALFSIFHTSYFITKNVTKIRIYHKEFLNAKIKFGPLFAKSRRVAVINYTPATDVALSLGLLNYTDLPGSMNEYAEKLAIDALQREKLDLVIVAKDNKVKVITREQTNKLKGR